MQIGDVLGIVVASAVLYFPLLWLHMANIKSGGIGFGDPKLPAPQAGLMAALAQGIVGGEHGLAAGHRRDPHGPRADHGPGKSPMLFAVGMYLPLETTFAIFIGGVIRWITDKLRDRRGFNDAQKARVENAGVLVASGLIAGEALTGLLIALFVLRDIHLPQIFKDNPPVLLGFAVLALLAIYMVQIPLRNAGHPDEPAPPTAIM